MGRSGCGFGRAPRIETVEHARKRRTKSHVPAHISQQHVDLVCADFDADSQAQPACALFARFDGGRGREVALRDTSFRDVQLEVLIDIGARCGAGGCCLSLLFSLRGRSRRAPSLLRRGERSPHEYQREDERRLKGFELHKGFPSLDGCACGVVDCGGAASGFGALSGCGGEGVGGGAVVSLAGTSPWASVTMRSMSAKTLVILS